jgi:hypothetical protein
LPDTDGGLNQKLLSEKAGLAPAFSFAQAGFAPPACPATRPQQTVDGMQAGLEIRARSYYVPSNPIGV